MRSKWLDMVVLIVLLALSSLSFAHAATVKEGTKTEIETKAESNSAKTDIEKYLTDGSITDGESKLTKYAKRHPSDDAAKFGLGILQFISGIEHVTQDLKADN